MTIQITRDEVEMIEREYEAVIQANLSDDEDVFLKFKDIGMCKIKKGLCRSVIDYANKQLNNGRVYVNIKIDHYE
jgi:hypothetical protein